MGLGISRTTVTPIAIDFGAAGLKALQLTVGPEPELVAAATLETPGELLADDGERLSFQANALPTLLKGAGFKGRRAVCSVSPMHTCAQSVQVQRAQGVSFRELVWAQLRTALGRDPDGMIVRHHEVCEIQRDGQKRSEVLCIAMGREVVSWHMQALRAAKLDPVGMHSVHLSALRSLDPVTKRADDGEKVTLIVDLGYSATNIVFAHGRTPVFAKTVHVGGRTMDQDACAGEKTPDLAAQRRRRIEHGFAADAAPAATTAGAGPAAAELAGAEQSAAAAAGSPLGRLPGVARGAAEPTEEPAVATATAPAESAQPSWAAAIDGIVDEVSMAMRYHQVLFADRAVDRTIFVGGEARSVDLCRLIARRLRLAAAVADPLGPLTGPPDAAKRATNVDVSTRQPGWATALGLCLARTDL